MVQKLLKKTFLGSLALSELHVLECFIMPRLISDERCIRRYYKKYSGKEPDLKNPVTFSEKLNWYKLNHRSGLMEKCADKVEVRDYVKEKGYGDTLNDIIGVYDNVRDIDIGKLPERFVLKAAHGSHMNIIVKDNKNEINWRRQRLMMRSWLRQDIYWPGRSGFTGTSGGE